MVMAKDAKFHVLAVDDSLMDRKLIETLLRTSSYQVTAVDSGSKALQVLGLEEDEQSGHDHQPHEVEINLIITDYCMPGMTGYDLLRKIKESSSLRDIPVVIMSSENNPSRISRCLEEGAEDFFLKPVQMSDVSKLRPHLMKGKGKESEREGSGMRESLQMCLSTVAERTSRAILGKNSAGLEFGNGLRMSYYTSTCSDNLLKWKIQIAVSIFFLLILVFPSWIIRGYMLN